MKRIGLLLAVGGVVLGAATVWACSVPVYRYALERWPPEPYEAYVFHRGPLPDAAAKTLDQLRAVDVRKAPEGVVYLQVVDVSDQPDGEAAKVWENHSSATLPHLVVRYPRFFGIPPDMWAGPLSDESVALVLDSPARRRVARRILEGDSAVFVLLEIGDPEQDDAAARLVETELERLEELIEVPSPPGGMWDDPIYDAEGPPQLVVAFSVLRLSREDPAERAFLEMLLGIEEDLHELKEPMVFPIFGRGRALCALVGKGINKENIEDVCGFLVGPCSCIVKSQNPGVDLLFSVEWDAALMGEESAIPEIKPPPLTGFSEFAQVRAEGGGDTAGTGAKMLWHVSLAVLGGLVIVAAAGLVIWRKAQSAEH